MLPITLIHTHEPQPSLIPDKDARVSAFSVFSDDEWDFTTEINRPSLTRSNAVINWRFQVTKERDALDPAYSTMLLALKQLAFTMLFRVSPRKCITVVATIGYLKCFVRFLGNLETPIYRFQDVLESDLERYIKGLKLRSDGSGELAPASFANALIQLNKLFEYKDYLSDYLRFKPTKNKTPAQVAGSRKSSKGSKTLAIPDSELKSLINAALNYIQHQAPVMFKCLEEYQHFAKTVDSGSFKASTWKSQYFETHFFSKRNDYQSSADLNVALLNLRTSCFVIIAFCTGMRISEILTIKRGCIRQQEDTNHGSFFWIDSLLFKTQKKNSGSPRSWMCGPLGAQAVAVLERMGELIGTHNHTQYLFFAFTHYDLAKRIGNRNLIKCLSEKSAKCNLKRFYARHHLGKKIHPHQFRRSFARNIIRYSSTSILALKEHFKHWSLYMTDWYIGLDQELIEDLEAERQLLSIEAMEKICTQTVGGAGGRRWTQELERRIEEGKLPRNFRGKAGTEFRKKMIGSFHESSMMVIPCGAFTYCVFQKDLALCTKGDRPVVNKCNPYDCANSYILSEHVPFYRGKLKVLQNLFGELSEEEKISPVGLLYSREMLKIRKSLETFNEI
jgi:integrase